MQAAGGLISLPAYIIAGLPAHMALGLTAGLFCIAGHYIGSGLVVHNGQRIVRPVILVVLAILFVKIAAL